MRIDGNRWIAVLALSTAASLSACTVEPANSGLGTGVGTGGGGGSKSGGSSGSAGKGGSAGSEPDGATDDVAEAGPNDASDAGQIPCFADEGDAGDAGVEDDCSSLPYWNVLCSTDGGLQKPQGMLVCLAYQGSALKPSALRQVMNCLKALPAVSPCSPEHFNAANMCSANLYTHESCTLAPETFDGGMYGCPEIAASCPGGEAGTGAITVARCNSWLDPWTAAARREAIECYLDPSSPGENCFDKLDRCIRFPELPEKP
ncbi:MAG TPA: hypothetical protein VF881_08260 [Polyangiaceae bacterium]